jgi:hypothetical protein
MKLEFLGQVSFRATPPLDFPVRFIGPNERRAQATRFQAPVTTDSVMVIAILNGNERQRGTVLRSQLAEAQAALRGQRFLPLDESNSVQFSLQELLNRRFIFVDEGGRYSIDVINRALAALGFRQIEFMQPGGPPPPPYWFGNPSLRRQAQVRSRGGFATLFGPDGTLGQDESIPGISIECSKCAFWEKETGSVATGCACEPDPLKIGGAALVVGGLIWYFLL